MTRQQAVRRETGGNVRHRGDRFQKMAFGNEQRNSSQSWLIYQGRCRTRTWTQDTPICLTPL